MQEEIKYMTKVEIKKLWGYEDLNFVWNLNPDVNILAGDNGSGKSTVLNLIVNILRGTTDEVRDIIDLVNSMTLTFDNSGTLKLTNITEDISSLEKKKENPEFADLLNRIKRHDNYDEIRTKNIEYSIVESSKEPFVKPKLSVINTFDQRLLSEDIIKLLKADNAETQLDLQIYLLRQQYSNYQINIGKRAIEALQKGENNISKIDAKRMLFLDTIDTLFSHTQKKIDRTKNEISFIQRGEKEISPYQLSSGEKQMLIILLTTLVQDEKHFILIMDEPEISLHPDWQENLIDNIRKLNDNVQIIIATHSPSIVINGWKDKVFEMSEIQTKN